MSKLASLVTFVIAAIQAIIGAVSAFGVGITGTQKDAVMFAVSAVLALVAAWFSPAVPIGPKSMKKIGDEKGLTALEVLVVLIFVAVLLLLFGKTL